MLTERALAREVRPAVLERGRSIVRYGYITRRSCRYKGDLTALTAKVESSSRYGYADYYSTTLTVNEATDEVTAYSCTCPAAAQYAGPCKHSVALGLDFIDRPEGYKGHDPQRHVVTSRELANLLDRTAPQQAAQGVPAEGPGAVHLELTLVAAGDGASVFARLRIVGSQGGYVVKNLADFADDVMDGATVNYGKKLTVTHDEASFDPESWQVAQWVVRGVRNRRAFSTERYYGYYYSTSTSGTGASMGRELRLSMPELDELLDLYLGHELQFAVSDQAPVRSGTKVSRDRVRTLTVADGDPEVSVEVVPGRDGSYELLRRGSLGDALQAGRRLYVIQGDRLLRCSEDFARIADFLVDVYCSPNPHVLLAADDAPRFAATVLPRLEEAIEVTVPADLAALRPVPAELAFYLDRAGQVVTAEVYATYGEARYQLHPVSLTGARDPRRDLQAEASARQLASRYFAQVRSSRDSSALAWEIPVRDADAVARLVFGGVARMRELGEVFTTQAFDRLVSTARPRVRVGVSVESDLLRLRVSADDLPLDELHAVLASYRRRKTYHRLRDGSLLDLTGLDLAEAAELADELGVSAKQLAAGVVEMPAYKAFLLENLVSDDEKDDSFYEWLDDFRSVELDSFEPPASIADTLRPYQRQGYQWLCALAEMGFGGILADEMGLGKTVQLIAFLLGHRGRGRSLVVCPASLVYNWQAEFGRFAPQMDVAVVAGTAAQRRAVRAERGHEVLITSYDLLRRDVQDYATEDLYCVVLDEAQYIKNHQTLAAQAVKTLAARHRFALTGTPVENRLSELWSIFDFLMPGLLGGYERFRDRYEAPIVGGDELAAERLRAAVGPFILRRLKRDVLTDLPDKLETPIVAQMEKEQRKLYVAHEQALRLSLTKQGDAELARGKLQVLAELTRLRQLCCDPRLVYEDYKGGSCKLDTIWELVAASVDAGAKVLVFSQFTSFLALIAERLRKEHVAFYELTGSTPKKRRLELADAFNTDDTPAFLVSLKAGGTGLNLIGAQVVIHADPWWNVAAEDQATDRAHRIGQKSDVSVYKVICKGTIEERIVALQAAKADLADAIVGEGEGLSLGSLSREDLLDLLG